MTVCPGVELALAHLLTLATQKQIHIFCDCLSAIDSVSTGRTQQTYQPAIDSIQALIRTHDMNQRKVNLHWTPRHIDLQQNEMADKMAKQAAEEAKELPLGQAQLTIKDAKSIIKEALRDRWQRQWNRIQDSTLIQSCYRKVCTTRYKSVMSPTAESCLIRLLSGHNRLKEHMHRIKYAQTPNCSCGLGIQNTEHVLISCPNLAKQRLELHLEIEQAYHTYNVPPYKRISSMQNILAPDHTKEVNTAILKATGRFLDSINLKI